MVDKKKIIKDFLAKQLMLTLLPFSGVLIAIGLERMSFRFFIIGVIVYGLLIYTFLNIFELKKEVENE